jgi:hypothetical protein
MQLSYQSSSTFLLHCKMIHCNLFLPLPLVNSCTQTLKKNRVPYLVVVDDFSDYIHCLRMEGKPSHVLLKKVKEVVNEYKSWGYGVGTIRSDSEAVYRSIKSDINFLGIRSVYAPPPSPPPSIPPPALVLL